MSERPRTFTHFLDTFRDLHGKRSRSRSFQDDQVCEKHFTCDLYLLFSYPLVVLEFNSFINYEILKEVNTKTLYPILLFKILLPFFCTRLNCLLSLSQLPHDLVISDIKVLFLNSSILFVNLDNLLSFILLYHISTLHFYM